MSKTLVRLLPAAACLLPNLLFAAAQTAPQTAAATSQASESYTVQAGDTLVGIARRLGLTPQALAKANALDRPDKIVVGNVLRLPVTPPDTNQTAPAAAKASAEQPGPAAAPPEPAQPSATPQAKPPAPVQTMSQSPSPTPVQTMPQAKTPSLAQPPAQPPAKADTKAAGKAATPDSVPPPATAEPAQAPTPSAKADDATGDAARLAVGTYANPTLGSLRVTQTATGIAVSRDNRTIAMRHLLYGVFDGVDASGDIHGLRLQYDEAGQVRALLYSSSSGKDIPFARVKK